MPTSVTQLLKINPIEFAKTGAFDAILDIDTHLFIDPFLLKGTSASELSKSYAKIHSHFGVPVSGLHYSQVSSMKKLAKA